MIGRDTVKPRTECIFFRVGSQMQKRFRECFLHEIFDFVGRRRAGNWTDEPLDTTLMALDKFRIRALLAGKRAAHERFILELPLADFLLRRCRFRRSRWWHRSRSYFLRLRRCSFFLRGRTLSTPA